MKIEELKKNAAEKAVQEISSGMIVGLGTGSTVQFALEKISYKIKNGELKNIRCISSSVRTETEANKLGIPLTNFEELIMDNGELRINDQNSFSILNSQFSIDITIDGADECDEELNLIKGGGGALLREKILAQASKRLIIIVDESKLSKDLGTKWPVPVEVIQFAADVEQKFLESLDAKVVKRKNADGKDYITDENNFILDADFGEIKNPAELATLLNQRAGIVEHGLFIGMTSELICAMNDGSVRVKQSAISN
ncbi:MAG: ribose-5-phosphate isomerase RpiA [Melioribacteraceae bacterium]